MPLTRITTENISNNTIQIQDLSANTVNALMYTANTAASNVANVTVYNVAWANFDGTSSGTITPRASARISSITKQSTGQYIVNLSSALPDTNYAVTVGTGTAGVGFGFYIIDTITTSSFRVVVNRGDITPSVRADSSVVMVSVFR